MSNVNLPVAEQFAQCASCGSTDVLKYSAEMALHCPGLKNIDRPPFFVFTPVLVCRDCGVALIKLPPQKAKTLPMCEECRASLQLNP